MSDPAILRLSFRPIEVRGAGDLRQREVFDGLRCVAKTGAPWLWMPNDPPP